MIFRQFLGRLRVGPTFRRMSRIWRVPVVASSGLIQRILMVCSGYVLLSMALLGSILVIGAVLIIGRLGVRFSRNTSKSRGILAQEVIKEGNYSWRQENPVSLPSASTARSSIVIDGRRLDFGQLNQAAKRGRESLH